LQAHLFLQLLWLMPYGQTDTTTITIIKTAMTKALGPGLQSLFVRKRVRTAPGIFQIPVVAQMSNKAHQNSLTTRSHFGFGFLSIYE